MSQKRVAPLLTAMLAVLLSGCGPSISLKIGLQVDKVSVLLGRPADRPPDVPPPPPPLFQNQVPNFPAPGGAPPPPFNDKLPEPPLDVNPCPTPSVFAVPKFPETAVARQLPAPGVYPFRYNGKQDFNPGTASVSSHRLFPGGTREVLHVQALKDPLGQPTGSFTFDIKEAYDSDQTTKYDGATTITSFLVQPNSTSTPGGSGTVPPPPTQPNSNSQAGLYLRGITSTDPSFASQSTFTPAQAVLIMPFPGVENTTFQSGGGADGANGTAMQVDPNSTINLRENINACGQVLRAWQVHLTGHFVNQFTDVKSEGSTTFDWTFDVAPQYGGLILSDHLVETGTDVSTGTPVPYAYDVQDTINVAPNPPQK